MTAGGCFDINLRAPPFSFPVPLETFAESGKGIIDHSNNLVVNQYPKKYLLLYKLSDLCQVVSMIHFIALSYCHACYYHACYAQYDHARYHQLTCPQPFNLQPPTYLSPHQDAAVNKFINAYG